MSLKQIKQIKDLYIQGYCLEYIEARFTTKRWPLITHKLASHEKKNCFNSEEERLQAENQTTVPAGITIVAQSDTATITVESTEEPEGKPSTEPTEMSEVAPSTKPTEEPEAEPSTKPTEAPEVTPGTDTTEVPEGEPSTEPTEEPEVTPGTDTTETPEGEPSAEPTEEPEGKPGVEPSDEPGIKPAGEPGIKPESESISMEELGVQNKIYTSLQNIMQSNDTKLGQDIINKLLKDLPENQPGALSEVRDFIQNKTSSILYGVNPEKFVIQYNADAKAEKAQCESKCEEEKKSFLENTQPKQEFLSCVTVCISQKSQDSLCELDCFKQHKDQISYVYYLNTDCKARCKIEKSFAKKLEKIKAGSQSFFSKFVELYPKKTISDSSDSNIDIAKEIDETKQLIDKGQFNRVLGITSDINVLKDARYKIDQFLNKLHYNMLQVPEEKQKIAQQIEQAIMNVKNSILYKVDSATFEAQYKKHSCLDIDQCKLECEDERSEIQKKIFGNEESIKALERCLSKKIPEQNKCLLDLFNIIAEKSYPLDYLDIKCDFYCDAKIEECSAAVEENLQKIAGAQSDVAGEMS